MTEEIGYGSEREELQVFTAPKDIYFTEENSHVALPKLARREIPRIRGATLQP